MTFKRINISQTQELLTHPDSILVDIRDTDSYILGHADAAINLNQTTLADFLLQTAKDSPILVMCYHGNSSQLVAQAIAAQGFEKVYSIDGGYEAWECRGK